MVTLPEERDEIKFISDYLGKRFKWLTFEQSSAAKVSSSSRTHATAGWGWPPRKKRKNKYRSIAMQEEAANNRWTATTYR